jgi:predicted ATPase
MIVTRASIVDELVADQTQWPFTVPAVAAMRREAMSFDRPVTFLVGENGSGKSTIVEGIAEAYGADVRGGHIGRRYASPGTKGPLGSALQLDYVTGTNMRRRPRGFFLRAETAYGVFGFMSDHNVHGYGEEHLLHVSHGESFLQVFGARFNEPGLYLLDEPEAALSFSSCLALLAVLDELGRTGAQVVCATHSPVLASLPDATVLQLSDDGIAPVAWSDLALVDHWRRYLAAPEHYLRHLLPRT